MERLRELLAEWDGLMNCSGGNFNVVLRAMLLEKMLETIRAMVAPLADETKATSKTVTALLMSARSMLRQARCPECQRNGMQGDGRCHWCRERCAVMDAILEQPSDETRAATRTSNECACCGRDKDEGDRMRKLIAELERENTQLRSARLDPPSGAN